MNLRPFGPEPNALPSCATPRSGAKEGTRTPDLRFTKPLLYRLSHFGIRQADLPDRWGLYYFAPPLSSESLKKSQSAAVVRFPPTVSVGRCPAAYFCRPLALKNGGMTSINRRPGSISEYVGENIDDWRTPQDIHNRHANYNRRGPACQPAPPKSRALSHRQAPPAGPGMKTAGGIPLRPPYVSSSPGCGSGLCGALPAREGLPSCRLPPGGFFPPPAPWPALLAPDRCCPPIQRWSQSGALPRA